MMNKIITLFARNSGDDWLVRNEVVPGSEWVSAGEGVATRKYDGTCCRVLDGKLWRRYGAKGGRVPPLGFEPAQAPDLVTGHWPGWLLVGDSSNDRLHREAWDRACALGVLPDGTYELIGPQINGNPEGLDLPDFVTHGAAELPACPRTFEALREYLRDGVMEGVVWHHPDGRMVKIKGKDFGFKRRAALWAVR